MKFKITNRPLCFRYFLVLTMMHYSLRRLENDKCLYQLFEEKLQCLRRKIDSFPFHVTKLEASFTSVIFEMKIQKAEPRRLANAELGLNYLILPFKRDRNIGVKSILQERGFKRRSHVLSKLSLGKCTEKQNCFIVPVKD